MRLVQVNDAFDPRVRSADALLEAYPTLTGWSEAVVQEGLQAAVVQAFSSDAVIGARRGVDYVFCRRTSDQRLSREMMCERVAACHPDVVHVNGLSHLELVPTLRRHLSPGVALVVQDHGGGGPPGWKHRIARAWRSKPEVDGYLFTSREQARPWVEAGVVGERDPIYEVLEASTAMHPVDRAEARRTWGVGDAPSVVWVGRLDRNKDPLTVLEGFERFLQLRPSAVLLMAYGDDRLLGDVRRRLSASGTLAGRVRLLGCVPHADMPRLYSAADLFVLGSHHEGSGYALLEACACGVVPVVTDIAPFRKITGGGAVGARWTPGDPVSCAAALARAFEGDRTHARHAVMRHFAQTASWRAVGAQARTVYEEVCRKRLAGQER